jgi:hypothetical protein
MKAQNNKEINRGYLQFSLLLVACVLTGVCIYSFYMKTLEIEVNLIVDKTNGYDKIYVHQNDLVNRIDSLYQYANLFNTNLNDAQLLNAFSARKQEISASMNDMNNRDVRLFRKLLSEMNGFLSLKDSIRILSEEETLLKRDLRQCVEDNKQTSRKLTIGGITLKK